MKTGFVLSMVLRDVRGKMDKHYYVQSRVTHYSGARLESILNCSWNVWALQLSAQAGCGGVVRSGMIVTPMSG